MTARLRATGRKVRVLFATQFALMAEYRAEVVIWMLSGTLSLVMMLVWMAQAAAAPGGAVRGYTPTDFATYFLSTWLVSQLLVVWVSHELDFEIRQGTLSPKLLRPLDPFWQHLLGHVSERFIRIIPMLALVGVFTWLSGAQFTGQLWAYPAALGLTLLGFVARFLWEYTIGLLAFWTDSSTSFQELVWLVYAALGGMFAPLTFYPEWVQRIAVWTPFPYMLGLPSQLLAGKASPTQAAQGALVLAAWLAVFWVVRWAAWRAGLKKYGAVGA
ncbi:ABC transporter permease [Deinococcus yunweiensis]|uniref:ABC transporter permease n=1 Tax=Deinococcus yunweiensis TaxID=367282 RepID=UPI00398E6188